MRITASSLERAKLCPASSKLPRIRRISAASERGTVVHQYLSDCLTIGADAAIENVPEFYKDLCSAFDLDGLPCKPESFASEVAFAWDPIFDTAREIGRDIDREYPADEFCGTIDVIGVTADAVVVYDYKGAYSHAEKASKNMQLRAYALMAARAYGKSRAIVGIIRVREDGMPAHYDLAELDAMDLDAAAHEIREILADESTEPVIGPHCQYCECIQSCPAMRATYSIVDPMTEITSANASAVLARLQAVEKTIDVVKDALKAYATTEPIRTIDGKLWGPVDEKRDSLDGEIARGVIANLHGADVAMKSMRVSTSKTSIKEALKTIAPKGKLASMERETIDAIRAAGGVTVGVVTKFVARNE